MRQFTVSKDGFHGFLHTPAEDRYPGKAVIVAGGSEGNDQIARKLGKKFAEHGLTALGVCCWNVPDLPEELVEVPVESIEHAVNCLKAAGVNRTAMYGISKGGELALLAASLIPEISCVVAVSPLHAVMAGITGNKSILRKGFAKRSSYTWRGRPLPFVSGRMRKVGVLRRLVTERQMDMRFLYENALLHAPEDAVIPVERIQGPVLLLCPRQDTMWPSDVSCREIERRLREHGHPYPIKRVEYDFASHLLVPLENTQLRFFRVEREYPRECRKSREEAFRETLRFLSEW